MTGFSNLLFVLAIPCLIAGIVLMMSMAGALRARGHKINWLWIRLFILKYIAQYREVTIRETGHPGPLFYPFVVSMNSALLLVVAGALLRLAPVG
jgi:hypothetical protein